MLFYQEIFETSSISIIFFITYLEA